MGAMLTQEQFELEAGFRLFLSIMKHLVEESLLTQREYGQIERLLTQKFSPVWAGLPGIIKDKPAGTPSSVSRFMISTQPLLSRYI